MGRRFRPRDRAALGRSGARALAGAVALAALAGGCFRHVDIPYSAARANLAVPAATETASDFAPPRWLGAGEVLLADRGETEHYRRYQLAAPSVGDNGQPGRRVTARFYRSKRPGARPLVVVLPIWGSYEYPPREMTWNLLHASDGRFDVLWLEGDHDLFDWPALERAKTGDEFLSIWRAIAERDRVNIVDIRRLVDWASTRPDVDPARIGLVGFSHSAMVGAVVAAVEPRIRATALVMAGGRPAEVIANCPGSGTGDAASYAAKAFGWSRAEYAARLEPVYRALDPVRYPGRVDPARVLFIDAGRDDCIPADAREALWRALGRPERISIGYTHKESFLAMTPLGLDWLRYRVSGFFLRAFARHPAPRRGAVVALGAAGGR